MHRTGFSLASILLLTAVVAVFLAAVCPVWINPHKVHEGPLIAGVIVGSVIGTVIGVVIGLKQARGVGGIILGLLCGMVSGAAGGVLLAVPDKLPAMAIGSVVLILFGVAVRRFSDDK